MPSDEFSFEGLEPIEARILKVAPQIAYVVLLDRTDRKTDDRLGRFNFDEASATPYLAESRTRLDSASNSNAAARGGGGGDSADHDDDPADNGSEGYEDDDRDPGDEDDGDPGWPPEYDGDDEEDDEPDRPGPLTPQDLARAACCWIRDCARRNTVGEAMRRFRVRAWGPKGVNQVESGQFVCRNHAYTDEVDLEAADAVVRELQIPAPTFDQAATSGAVKGVKALGDYYAQWGRIVLGSVGQLQGVNNAMLARLHRQLQESRDQVDQLVAAILEARVAEVQAHDGRRADEHAADTRTQLARDALTQLGQAAQSFLLARGVPQDLIDSFQSISSSPDLVAALRDPRVRALMKDPDNLRSLAAMLRAAGAQLPGGQESPAPAADPPQPEPSAQG